MPCNLYILNTSLKCKLLNNAMKGWNKELWLCIEDRQAMEYCTITNVRVICNLCLPHLVMQNL